MEALGILFMLLLAGLFGYLVAQTGAEGKPEPERDPEAELKAALELHRIRRNLDVSLTKTDQRREADRMRRQIGEALDDHRP